ncbi:uncharacterized protein TNCV_4430611 [Trichonephila clavipes]|nr:uncharacterized protein TNCV_4430611 [Trichonephila clavipes]
MEEFPIKKPKKRKRELRENPSRTKTGKVRTDRGEGGGREIVGGAQQFEVPRAPGRVHVWSISAQAYDCLLPTVKHGSRSVMIWAAESGFPTGPIVSLKGRIPGKMNREILVYQIHPMMQTLFPAGDRIFQDNNTSVHVAGCPILL